MIESRFVVVRQHASMNHGNSGKDEALNYYVGEQRYYDDKDRQEWGQCILLAHVGFGVKGLSRANQIVNIADDKKLTASGVQELAWKMMGEEKPNVVTPDKPKKEKPGRMTFDDIPDVDPTQRDMFEDDELERRDSTLIRGRPIGPKEKQQTSTTDDINAAIKQEGSDAT